MAIGLVEAAVVLFCGWTYVYRSAELTSYHGDGGVEVEHVGETQYFTELVGPTSTAFHDTTIDLRGLRPVIRTNTARATVRVLLCTSPEPSGGSSNDLADFCQRARAWTPGVTNLDPRRNEFIVAVSPTRPGKVMIAGLEITYRDGIRHGKQHAGTDIGAVVPS